MVMVDSLVSLAFSVHGNPGVYALLLGSGVSRSAGVPTGWEVVQDLIKRLASIQGQEAIPDAEQWYKTTYDADPDYSDLLDQLVKTPNERSQLLRSYFEPTDEERARGIKLPTPAHRAIAELVKEGYVRVIITTNFDRLLETALADSGVQPSVVSTPDAIKGALPLPHVRCLLLKINGDYLDTRIKNTQAELTEYDPALNALLDRLFDEFGLIVCGWSGDWDTGLRGAIERCPNRRFSTYWAAHGEPTLKASDLITLRSAGVIKIESSDSFFLSLREKLLALSQFGQHPLSAKLATAETKRHIVRTEDRVLLHDLVYEETERAYGAMNQQRFHYHPVADSAAELAFRLGAYQSIVEVPLAIMMAGAFWGQQEHEYLWQHMIKRVGELPQPIGQFMTAWFRFRRYPASLLMYTGGIAAIAGRQYGNLAAVLNTPLGDIIEREVGIAAMRLNIVGVMQDNLSNFMPNRKPFSDYVFENLRELFRSAIPRDADYDDAFDLFEYLLGVVVWHAHSRVPAGFHARAPIGRAAWRNRGLFSEGGPTSQSDPQTQAIANALFPNGVADYNAAKTAYDAWAMSLPLY